MTKDNNIEIHLRVRPVGRPSSRLSIDQLENRVEFNIPREASAGCGVWHGMLWLIAIATRIGGNALWDMALTACWHLACGCACAVHIDCWLI